MKNVAGYHNAEKMGYSYLDRGDPFRFMTKKAVDHLVGAKVWAINGAGRPRVYSLAAWFLVDKVEPSAGDPSIRIVQGKEGQLIQPMIRLNELPWFSRFQQSQGNFGFGLQTIDDELVPHFEALAAEAADSARDNEA